MTDNTIYLTALPDTQLPICHTFRVIVDEPGTLTFRTLDGDTTSYMLEVGSHAIDVESDLITWTGVMSILAGYNPESEWNSELAAKLHRIHAGAPPGLQ